MGKLALAIFVIATLLASSTAFAYRKGSKPSWDTDTYGHDAHGRLTRRDNFHNDTDGDGVSNYYDRSDSNPWKS